MKRGEGGRMYDIYLSELKNLNHPGDRGSLLSPQGLFDTGSQNDFLCSPCLGDSPALLSLS